jgi:hypothetical protein
MTFPKEVPLPCGCISVLDGGVYRTDHTCSKQQRRAKRLAEIHQSNDASQRRSQSTLQGDRSFRFLR